MHLAHVGNRGQLKNYVIHLDGISALHKLHIIQNTRQQGNLKPRVFPFRVHFIILVDMPSISRLLNNISVFQSKPTLQLLYTQYVQI